MIFGAAAMMAGLAMLASGAPKILLHLSGREFQHRQLYGLVMIGNFFGQAIPSVSILFGIVVAISSIATLIFWIMMGGRTEKWG